MKKLLSILLALGALTLVSCEGEMGPPGIPGESGEDAFIGTIFEIDGDFTFENEYTLYTTYPSELIVYDTDVVLVYILWEVVDGLDVWRLCPQTIVIEEDDPDESGVIQYNFDYTVADVQVFMEFTVPENSLRSVETENQVFRIAVLPANSLKSVNVSDFNSLLQAPEFEFKMLDKVELETIPEIEIK